MWRVFTGEHAYVHSLTVTRYNIEDIIKFHADRLSHWLTLLAGRSPTPSHWAKVPLNAGRASAKWACKFTERWSK